MDEMIENTIVKELDSQASSEKDSQRIRTLKVAIRETIDSQKENIIKESKRNTIAEDEEPL